MLINKRIRHEQGFGLAEQIIALGIASILGLVMLGLLVTTTREVSRTVSFSEMNASSQNAMDTLTRDIRQANRVTAYTTNTFRLESADGTPITYAYDARLGTLTRTRGAQQKVLLRQCQALTFSLGKRSPTGAFATYPVSSVAECKVVNVSWRCARNIAGQQATREVMSTGDIVIRRQGT